jgi:hypothetical protein
MVEHVHVTARPGHPKISMLLSSDKRDPNKGNNGAQQEDKYETVVLKCLVNYLLTSSRHNILPIPP